MNEFVKSLRNNFTVSGKVEYIIKDQLLMMSFHEANSKGSLNNLFKAVDLSTGKYILEEVINKETGLYLTDSFFVKDNLLFLLFGKTRLVVYKIIILNGGDMELSNEEKKILLKAARESILEEFSEC